MTYEERRLIEAAPKLTDEEKRAINALFPA
jgi:hypothetical protein